MTCDYGVRQRSRACSSTDQSQCSALSGLSVETEYCFNAQTCPGMATTTVMSQHGVSSSTFQDYVSTSVTSSVGDEMPPIMTCAHQCLRQREDRNDVRACNSFAYVDGVCRLGYVDPNLVTDNLDSPDVGGQLFVDMPYP